MRCTMHLALDVGERLSLVHVTATLDDCGAWAAAPAAIDVAARMTRSASSLRLAARVLSTPGPALYYSLCIL